MALCPVPLMQNYIIKSVKMTKKSIFRDQFSWKVRTFALEIVLTSSVMTTVELRTSIVAELDQMSVEMLESVQHYVRRLRRHARPTRRASATKAEAKAETKEFTPRVMRFKRGNPWYATDEEVDRLRYEFLTEKFK